MHAMIDQRYVYVIGHPEGFVKIGRSKDPEQRLQEIQTSSPYDLWIIAQFPVDNSNTVEGQLHDRFSDRNVRGEWYEFDIGEYDAIFDMAEFGNSHTEATSIADIDEWRRDRMEALL